ncbi:MAG: C39 family peptidase [Chloroflexota bacterium]|nr:C39 family peptidase [Chloroflexota bacterium]
MREALGCLVTVLLAPIAVLALVAVGLGSWDTSTLTEDSFAFMEPPPPDPAATYAGQIPANYLRAYKAAGEKHDLDWQIIAGIGWVETRHGTYGEVIDGCIVGVPVVSYGGQRAQGPMQFMPPIWETYGEDGNGDGIADPCDIRDAPFSTARHLLDPARSDLAKARTPENYYDAVCSYHGACGSYVSQVLAAAAWYGYGGNAMVAADPSGNSWYRYQGEADSGEARYVNCGPASVAMAVQRYTGARIPVASIRNQIPGNTLGYTSMGELTSLLGQYGVRYRWSIAKPSDIRQALRRGNPVMALVRMGYIDPGADYNGASASPGLRTGRYNDFAGGHYFIIRGVTEDGGYYRIHDPLVFLPLGYATYWYSDDSPKGRDRLYPVEEAHAAMYAYGGNQAVELLPPGSAETHD